MYQVKMSARRALFAQSKHLRFHSTLAPGSMPRVLLVNDDGPPGEQSPFVISFVKQLIRAGIRVTVCLPASQQSWKGKSQDPLRSPFSVTPTTLFEGGPDTWFADTTPCGVVNVALSHLCKDVDLVISGPNLGHNAGRVFMLSSGTLGAAMEAATMGYKAIAISFDVGREVGDTLDNTADKAVEVVSQLWATWEDKSWDQVEVFNVNLPVGASMETPVCRTFVCPDQSGALFSQHAPAASVPFMITRAMKARLAELGHTTDEIKRMKPADALQHLRGDQDPDPLWFSWTGVPRGQEVDPPDGSDRWALAQGAVSVTALKAQHTCMGFGDKLR